MMTQQECILTRILNCGSADLSILEDINYDLDEIIDELQEEGILSLSSILEAVFEKAKKDLTDIIKDRITDVINEIEGLDKSDEDYEKLNEEYLEIDSLKPEDDITYFINFLDTHIFIDSDKEEIYRKYFEDELDEIENNIGYSFKSN